MSQSSLHGATVIHDITDGEYMHARDQQAYQLTVQSAHSVVLLTLSLRSACGPIAVS